MKKLIVIIIVGFSFADNSYAQHEPIFTQYGMNQGVFNPAYSVVNNVVNVAMMSRVQWVGLQGAPFTNSLLASTTFFRNKGGAGLIIHNNKYGASNNIEVFAQASYKLLLGLNTQISVGIQGGYLNYRNDFTAIEEADLDPVFNTANENVTVPNIGMGLFFNTNNFYVGISIPKFMEYNSDESSSDLLNYKKHYYGSIGGILPAGLLKLKVFGLTIITESDFSYELGSSILLAETIWAGLFTRNLKAFGAMGQIELTDRLKAGLTIELPSTELVANQYGSYEAFISWEMAVGRKQLLKRRYF
ncbi:MAG: PorP/SprF family type IX secretion system membrane protein [Bacteroidota bacterium]